MRPVATSLVLGMRVVTDSDSAGLVASARILGLWPGNMTPSGQGFTVLSAPGPGVEQWHRVPFEGLVRKGHDGNEGTTPIVGVEVSQAWPIAWPALWLAPVYEAGAQFGARALLLRGQVEDGAAAIGSGYYEGAAFIKPGQSASRSELDLGILTDPSRLWELVGPSGGWAVWLTSPTWWPSWFAAQLRAATGAASGGAKPPSKFAARGK